MLLLDSDVIVFDDPYKYLKHPPFKDIVVINQEEGVLAPNGGVLYVQVTQTRPCLLVTAADCCSAAAVKLHCLSTKTDLLLPCHF